jgi:hypothetical protein
MAGAEGEAVGQATFYLEGGAGRALGLPPALEPGARSLCKGESPDVSFASCGHTRQRSASVRSAPWRLTSPWVHKWASGLGPCEGQSATELFRGENFLVELGGVTRISEAGAQGGGGLSGWRPRITDNVTLVRYTARQTRRSEAQRDGCRSTIPKPDTSVPNAHVDDPGALGGRGRAF